MISLEPADAFMAYGKSYEASDILLSDQAKSFFDTTRGVAVLCRGEFTFGKLRVAESPLMLWGALYPEIRIDVVGGGDELNPEESACRYDYDVVVEVND